MEATIESVPNPYGFGRDWSLVVKFRDTEKRFYLGQDVKFCSRVLGMAPREVVMRIGTGDIGNGTAGADKLAKLILSELDLSAKKLRQLEPWGLCCQ